MAIKRFGVLSLFSLLVLAGCGDGVVDNGEQVGTGGPEDVTDESASAFLARSVEETRAVESGRVEMTVAFEGAFDLPDVSATGEFTDRGRRVHIALEVAGADVETTIVDETLYADVAGNCTQSDLSELPTAAQPQPEGMTDPGALLDLLGGVDDGVTEEGIEEIRGVETTHLSGVLTLGEAVDQTDSESREDVERLLGQDFGEELFDAEIPVDVFVDADGLMRRAEMGIPSFEVAGIESPSGSMAIDYFDFGADIEIDAPEDCDDDFLLPENLGAIDQDFQQQLCDDAVENLGTLLEELPGDPCAELPSDLGTDGGS